MKTIASSVLIACAVLSGCSREIPPSKVPSIVMNSFSERFSDAVNTEWEKHQDLFEAEFELNKMDHAVRITNAGNITVHKQEVNPDELPAAINTSIRSAYQGYQLDNAEKLEIDGRVYYQLELDGKTSSVTKVFTETGGPAADIQYWD